MKKLKPPIQLMSWKSFAYKVNAFHRAKVDNSMTYVGDTIKS